MLNHPGMDISGEIKFRTARSGGKGGQSVNKVESMVEGLWDIDHSRTVTPAQKKAIHAKLANRINSEGFLQVRSQEHRSQLENKLTVIKKMTALIMQAIKKEKKRIATKPSKASKNKRLEEKKKLSDHKQNRQRIRNIDF